MPADTKKAWRCWICFCDAGKSDVQACVVMYSNQTQLGRETIKINTNFFMIWISLLHLSLFLGVNSRRHIFIASFSFVFYKTNNRYPIIIETEAKSLCARFKTSHFYILHPYSRYVGRGKHGQSLPCLASLSAPSHRTSGSVWREVSPLLTC